MSLIAAASTMLVTLTRLIALSCNSEYKVFLVFLFVRGCRDEGFREDRRWMCGRAWWWSSNVEGSPSAELLSRLRLGRFDICSSSKDFVVVRLDRQAHLQLT